MTNVIITLHSTLCSTPGDVSVHWGMLSTVGDTMSTLGGYQDACGGLS